MSGKEKPDPDFSAASSWELPHQSADVGDHSYFFTSDDYKDSTILNEFGWNIPPESSGDGGLGNFPPIEPDLADDMMRSSSTIVEVMVEASAASASNPSISSSSSEDQPEKSSASGVSSGAGNPPAEAAGKTKKKGEKRIRQPRFAFVTKSEVDHLEDGYRWRKYGQKAVKNSPFPRSYFRCTNSKCMVKKRIERSSEDPSVVITTYEGQHCHHSVGFPRGGGGGGGALITQDASPFPRFLTPNISNNNSSHHDLLYHHPRLPHPPQPTLGPRVRAIAGGGGGGGEIRASSSPPGQGLLGDIVPPRMRNNNG
ncbi:hypothetical protein C2S53_020814 [Perilla frutescens var. hirtella]|uniref:WRKY domain-containing protein n=1 Tax=Perilla frutescens var. hirtella TaxID=608512 RepID=A0AAD4IY32_PERFH|nr:hypothetical protein C2S53_020814 [Perilla frutescens var. hirtella]